MKSNFQIIVILTFIAFAIFGILVFSGTIPLGGSGDEEGALGTVVLWGTLRGEVVGDMIDDFNEANPSFVVRYVQKSSETFDQDLLEALAEGKGPDLFFLPDNLAFHYSNKIFTIPYQSYSIDRFKKAFVSAGEVFLTSKGMLAFPIAIDPMVMYYNRGTLDSKGVVYPPASWEDLKSLIPVIGEKDDSNKIIKSAVALGHFSNVAHAKTILAGLFMQAGNSIVRESDGFFRSMLSTTNANNLPAVLRFYTDFADPLNSAYSWNRSFPSSTDAFSAENLAFYFGYASELQSLVNRNPNQNFLPAPFPQAKGANIKLTPARVTGIAISQFSKNFNTAFLAASLLAQGEFASKYANALMIAPARRDLLLVKPADAYSPTFYDSALYARSWLDPSPKDTDDIFRRMIDGVLSNNLTPEDAIRDASDKLGLLLLQ